MHSEQIVASFAALGAAVIVLSLCTATLKTMTALFERHLGDVDELPKRMDRGLVLWIIVESFVILIGVLAFILGIVGTVAGLAFITLDFLHAIIH